MSAKASGYAKELLVCPNGEMISAREKLVLMVLADSHQTKEGCYTYPSVDTIAAEARCDRRSCQRYLNGLDEKGVIRRLRPPNQGAGMRTFYFFPELEAVPEGWQDAALLVNRRAGGRAAEGRVEGRQKGGRALAAPIERAQEREREREREPKNTHAALPRGSACPLERSAVLDLAADHVCATSAEAASQPEQAALSPAQIEHLDRLAAQGQSLEPWRRFYLEENEKARAAKAAADAEEARLRAMYPTRTAAITRLRKQCGFAWIKGDLLGPMFDQVFRDQEEMGRTVWSIAGQMVAMWELQRRQGRKLRARYGPMAFFRDGHWLDCDGWHWDNEMLKLEGARVGSERST